MSCSTLTRRKGLPRISGQRMETADRDEMVELMVEIYGQQSVEVTMEVLMMMNRRYLVQKLSETSSGLQETHQSKRLHKEVTMTSVEVKLLEMLEDLSYRELEQFIHVLQHTTMKKGLPRISGQRMETADRNEMVELMVEIYGQQSVEVTMEVLMMMNRRDLVQKLSETSSGLQETHQSKRLHKEVTMTSVEVKLLEMLEDLSYGELEQFKHVLRHTTMKKGLPRISGQRMETADRNEMVELMVEIYGQQSVEVTMEVLMMMNRGDLVQKLSDISSGSKGPSTSLELEGCGSTMQFSSDWTKLQPEVTLTDADEAPTYSLQSEAGIFECSVSGLRWVCKEKVRFKYQFCSSERHMERMESLQYMPAGPLMDITVIAGKLDEVYLPHWICIDGNPEILDKFAVLHIDDCGDSVEKVSEVTSSHVKLSEPVFSLKMPLVKFGFSVEIHCKVLIYKTNIPFLTLHVYLIPPDPAVKQELDKTEVSCGNQRILKQHPKKPLKMNDWFILTADLNSREMCRDNLMLRYESSDPNFFDLFMKNPDTDIVLTLTQENDRPPVWTCVIQKDEYQSSTGPVQGQHFVDKHRIKLIERVSNIAAILDELLDEDVIQQETYDKIRVLPTCQEKMRELYSGPLNARRCKDIFYKILEEKERYLVDELKEMK
ncbi:NACHT, LRR and PYD domains-containing protein 1 homolog [Sander vitreus]